MPSHDTAQRSQHGVRLCDPGFILREPGRGRTIRLLVDRDAFPDLD
ncbi:MAG: hypothetical protein AAFN70_04460 [Planctomycetota bacterium]